jgi:hypothetical protein
MASSRVKVSVEFDDPALAQQPMWMRDMVQITGVPPQHLDKFLQAANAPQTLAGLATVLCASAAKTLRDGMRLLKERAATGALITRSEGVDADDVQADLDQLFGPIRYVDEDEEEE